MEQLPTTGQLISEIRQLIDHSRQKVAQTVNTELSYLYWRIGKLLRTEILKDERAAYGQQMIATLSRNLTAEYGRGWSKRLLWQCQKFAEVFPDEQIMHTVCAQLTWSHFRLLFGMEDPLKREFYMAMCHCNRCITKGMIMRGTKLLRGVTSVTKGDSTTHP
jgi:hypothetical protein